MRRGLVQPPARYRPGLERPRRCRAVARRDLARLRAAGAAAAAADAHQRRDRHGARLPRSLSGRRRRARASATSPCPRASPTWRWRRSAPCPCATAPAACRRSTASARAPALRPCCWACVLLVLGLGFAGSAAALFALIPMAAVGALLLVAGGDLAVSRRLFDAQPSCWPVIAVAAARHAGVQSRRRPRSPAAPGRSCARRCCAPSSAGAAPPAEPPAANRPADDMQLQGSSSRDAATSCSAGLHLLEAFFVPRLATTSSRAVATGQGRIEG